MTTTFDLTGDADAALEAAAEAVKAGECIVLPTDTVYGIGADAFDAAAVQRLLDAKERGRDMPPPVLVAEPSMLRAVADDVPAGAAVLAKAFWPGGLTLIVKAQPRSGMELGETRGTVAVRVPDHDGARALLRRTGPLAVSSANVSGRPAALDCDDARAQLGDRVAVYLDGGPVSGGVASTIVDFASTPEGRILRQGAIALEALLEVAPDIERPATDPAPQSAPAPDGEATPDTKPLTDTETATDTEPGAEAQS